MYEALINFLKLNYFVIGYGITFLVSLYQYGKYYDTVLKFLPILFAYTFLNELLGFFIRYYPGFSILPDLDNTSINEIIYNLYDLIFFPFFYYIYWKLIKDQTYKKYIVFGFLIVVASYLVNSFFQNPMVAPLYYANAIGCFTLIFCIVLYRCDKRKIGLKIGSKYNLVTWISIGLLLFHSIFPFLFLMGHLKYDIWEAYHFKTVLRVLVVLMYGMFTLGLVKSKRSAFG